MKTKKVKWTYYKMYRLNSKVIYYRLNKRTVEMSYDFKRWWGFVHFVIPSYWLDYKMTDEEVFLALL